MKTIDDKLIGQWTEGFKWSGLSGVWKIENHQLKSLVERAAKYGAEQVKVMESPKREFSKVATDDMKTVEQIMGLAGTYAYLSETQDANGRAFDEAEVALRTAIEELYRDAARYRWMRATNYVTSKGKRIDVRNNPEAWDEAIDAAMKEST